MAASYAIDASPSLYLSPSAQEKKSKKRHRDSSDKKSSKKKARYADAD